MDVQKLTVIRARLSREKLVRFRLNCARNDEMFTGILEDLIWKWRRMSLILEENIHNNYICVDSLYKEIYLIHV